MAHKTTPNRIDLDAIAWKILEALQQNARTSFAELGRKIGLSTPAVAERVHRLEEAGVITGYHACLDSARLGIPIRVVVRLTIPGGELQINRTVTAAPARLDTRPVASGYLGGTLTRWNTRHGHAATRTRPAARRRC